MKNYICMREKDQFECATGWTRADIPQHLMEAKDDSELLDKLIDMFPEDVKDGMGFIIQEVLVQ